MAQQTAVADKTIAEKYDELCKEVTRLQEKYDENGYDCSPMIKLQRIEATVDSVIKDYSKLTGKIAAAMSSHNFNYKTQ